MQYGTSRIWADIYPGWSSVVPLIKPVEHLTGYQIGDFEVDVA